MANIQSGAKRLLEASIAQNTHAVYNRALQVFEHFRKLYNLQGCWPVPVQQVVWFISYCFEQKMSAATIATYLSGLSFKHKIKSWLDPTNFFVVKKCMEGYRRLCKTEDCRAPITYNILINICNTLPIVCTTKYESLLFKAAFCLAYFGLLRVGELVYTTYRQTDQALNFNDIHLSKDLTSVIVCIRKSKTNQVGRPVFLKLPSEAGPDICPVQALSAFVHIRPPQQGLLFVHADSRPLTRYQFNAVLAKVIKHLGLPVSQFKSHSFRIGRATSLAMLGVSDDVIKHVGRWSSSAFIKYIRLDKVILSQRNAIP